MKALELPLSIPPSQISFEKALLGRTFIAGSQILIAICLLSSFLFAGIVEADEVSPEIRGLKELGETTPMQFLSVLVTQKYPLYPPESVVP